MVKRAPILYELAEIAPDAKILGTKIRTALLILWKQRSLTCAEKHISENDAFDGIDTAVRVAFSMFRTIRDGLDERLRIFRHLSGEEIHKLQLVLDKIQRKAKKGKGEKGKGNKGKAKGKGKKVQEAKAKAKEKSKENVPRKESWKSILKSFGLKEIGKGEGKGKKAQEEKDDCKKSNGKGEGKKVDEDKRFYLSKRHLKGHQLLMYTSKHVSPSLFRNIHLSKFYLHVSQVLSKM